MPTTPNYLLSLGFVIADNGDILSQEGSVVVEAGRAEINGTYSPEQIEGISTYLSQKRYTSETAMPLPVGVIPLSDRFTVTDNGDRYVIAYIFGSPEDAKAFIEHNPDQTEGTAHPKGGHYEVRQYVSKNING